MIVDDSRPERTLLLPSSLPPSQILKKCLNSVHNTVGSGGGLQSRAEKDYCVHLLCFCHFLLICVGQMCVDFNANVSGILWFFFSPATHFSPQGFLVW